MWYIGCIFIGSVLGVTAMVMAQSAKMKALEAEVLESAAKFTGAEAVAFSNRLKKLLGL